MRTVPLLILAVACNEYGFGAPAEPAEVPDPPATTPPPPPPPEAPPPEPGTEVATPTVPVLDCDDSYSETMPWARSPIWASAEPPEDPDGRAWYDVDFAPPPDWAPLGGLPDEDPVSEDHDLFYRAEFWLEGVAGTTEIEFVGNDGIWLYVNGWYVGHWGGAWREGGCINVDEGCGVNYDAPPTDITPYLVDGRNVVAVMLTNGPTGYYLEINASCVQ